MHTDKSAKTINCLIKAFHASMIRVSDETAICDYKVDGELFCILKETLIILNYRLPCVKHMYLIFRPGLSMFV